jgi:hypothetical protein
MSLSIKPRLSAPNLLQRTPPAPQRQQPMFDRSRFDTRPAPPARVTPAEAIERARRLLEGTPVEERRDDGSIIISNPPYVNAEETDKRRLSALFQLQTNATLETAALACLSPQDRQKYLETKEVLLAEPDADPVAALALQMMLLEGRLPGAPALGSSDTVLDGLHNLATQDLGEGIDRQQLLSDVVQEVAVPEAIAQRTFGTCAPTATEIKLAKDHPAEYVRLISGLASPDGQVTTVGGDVLRVEEGALGGDRVRSVSQQLLAPALMELGNGDLDYSNEEDGNYDANGERKGAGLSARGVDTLLESLYGRDFAYTNTDSAEEREAGVDFIEEELAAGRDVLIGVDWGTGGHKLLVTGVEVRDGERYFRVINPWGQVELIPVTEVEDRLRNVNYDPNA